VLRGAGTTLDTRPYTAPVRETAPWIPPRDWGRRSYMYPVVAGNSDLGVLFMGVLRSTGYGFRQDPYADTHTARVGYATKAGSFGGDYTGEFRFENSPMWAGLYARISGLDFLHFYGFGNETQAVEDEDFYKVKHTEYAFAPSLNWQVRENTTFSVRIGAKYTKTDLQPDRLITVSIPTAPRTSSRLARVGALHSTRANRRPPLPRAFGWKPMERYTRRWARSRRHSVRSTARSRSTNPFRS
jgi:hypothetical protein